MLKQQLNNSLATNEIGNGNSWWSKPVLHGMCFLRKSLRLSLLMKTKFVFVFYEVDTYKVLLYL